MVVPSGKLLCQIADLVCKVHRLLVAQQFFEGKRRRTAPSLEFTRAAKKESRE
jgi:hypothetical protein